MADDADDIDYIKIDKRVYWNWKQKLYILVDEGGNIVLDIKDPVTLWEKSILMTKEKK